MRARTLFLMLTEHGATRALDALTTLVLIRTLDVSSFGTFAVYQSWVALLLLIFPALENMLYREHGRYKAQGRLAEELAAYRKANLVKLAAAIVLTLGGAALGVHEVAFTRRLAAMTLAFALPLAQALYGIYREPLRFELHQGTVVAISAAQRIAIITVVFVLGRVFGGAIEPVAAAALAVYFVFGGVWSFVSSSRLAAHGVPTITIAWAKVWERCRQALGEAVLWLHFSGAIAAAVQTLDVYFLSRTATPLKEIAVYSIALKAANFFQMVPLALTQAFGVYLGRRSGRGDAESADRKTVWMALGAFVVIAVALFAFGSVISHPLLAFLAKGKFSEDELVRAASYFRLMLAGVAVYSVGFIPGTYLSSRGNVRGLVLLALAPWFVFSLVTYGLAARQGPMTAALANLPVAAFYCIAHLVYFTASGIAARSKIR